MYISSEFRVEKNKPNINIAIDEILLKGVSPLPVIKLTQFYEFFKENLLYTEQYGILYKIMLCLNSKKNIF